jgi:hypothetical protein
LPVAHTDLLNLNINLKAVSIPRITRSLQTSRPSFANIGKAQLPNVLLVELLDFESNEPGTRTTFLARYVLAAVTICTVVPGTTSMTLVLSTKIPPRFTKASYQILMKRMEGVVTTVNGNTSSNQSQKLLISTRDHLTHSASDLESNTNPHT